MDFKEDKFMIIIALVIVALVISQAVFFLVRAMKRAKQLAHHILQSTGKYQYFRLPCLRLYLFSAANSARACLFLSV